MEATPIRRAVERAYVRLILDPAFERRVRDDDAFAAALGLDAADVSALRQIPAEPLAVERRGRWRSLWSRVQAQLPATAARLQAVRGEAGMAALWADYYASDFWAFDHTLDVPPHGPGMEMASTVRLWLRRDAARRPSREASLLCDLCELELRRFRARVLAEGPFAGASDFDLERAAAAPTLATEALTAPLRWQVRPGGEVEYTRPAAALTLAPALHVRLESDRLGRYHSASTLYFTLGEQAAAINAAHAALLAAPAADRWFTRSGAGWQLRPEVYFRPTPSILDATTRLELVRRVGGEVVASFPVDRAALRALGELLPRLRPSLPAERLLAELEPAARALLDRLQAVGAVVPRPCAPAARPRDHGVTLVGHACLLLESPSTRVLVDPLLTVRNRPEVDASAVLDAGIDAIVISHCHWDHLNFDTLLHVPRAATVVVPRTRHPTSITNLDIAAVCRELGFSSVVALDPWQSTAIGDITLTALPYHGENGGADGVHDWMTYHAALGGRSLLGLVDACRDAHGDTDAVVHDVHRRLGPVDVLFAPSSDFHYPISNYTRRPFYVGDAHERYTGGPDDVARWAAIAGAGVVVPYALFHLLPADVERDAAAVARDRYRRGGLAELRARLPAPPRGPLCVLRPGDRLAWSPGGSVRWQTAAAPAEVRR